MSDAEPAAHMAPEPVRAPVEQKVTASSRGAGLGGALAGIVLWALGEFVFHGEVPGEVSGFVIVAIPALGAFIDGYRAPHTARPARSVALPQSIPVE